GVTLEDALEVFQNLDSLMQDYYIQTLDAMGIDANGLNAEGIYQAYREYLAEEMGVDVSTLPAWSGDLGDSMATLQLIAANQQPSPVPFPTNPFADYNEALITYIN